MSKKNVFVSFMVGLVFAVGLGLSGMTRPEKVVGFLDIFGNWDPSLAFVMIGAIGFHAVFYRIIMKQDAPLFTAKFMVPDRRDITWRLVVGSALFGIGWGIAGYCPGPGLASMSSLDPRPLVFVAAMIAGMLLFRFMDKKLPG